jgi:hypothetical protein
MEMPLMLFLTAVVGVAFIALGVWAGKISQRRMLANLTALAARQGLTVQSDGGMWSTPSLVGEQQGRRVRLWAFTTGSGKSRVSWIAAGVAPRSLGKFSFDLRPQGMFSKLGELFGAKEALTGAAAFDARWYLQTSAPDLLAAALVPEIRARLDAAFAAGARGHFRTEEGFVCYAEVGSMHSEPKVARLESLLPLLRDLADVAEVCAGADQV